MSPVSYSTSSSSYTSSSTSNGATQTSGTRSAQSTSTDAQGNTITHSAYQNSGEPVVEETRQYDPQGRELIGGSGSSAQNRIQGGGAQITEVQDENDKKYLEAMEDEYAKREGGA